MRLLFYNLLDKGGGGGGGVVKVDSSKSGRRGSSGWETFRRRWTWGVGDLEN